MVQLISATEIVNWNAHQNSPADHRSPSQARNAFQRIDWSKRREIQRRIASRDDARDQDKDNADHPEPGVGPGDAHLFCRQLIEPVQRRHGQAERHAERDQDDDQRLAKELSDQLPAQGADGFADAHFPRPFLRPCRTEVHKIDTGQHQDKAPDPGNLARPSVQWFRRSLLRWSAPSRCHFGHGVEQDLWDARSIPGTGIGIR